jgi:hypothetical protein
MAPRRLLGCGGLRNQKRARGRQHVQTSAQPDDGADAEEADVVFRVLDREALGRIDDGRLAGVVPDQAWPRSDARRAGDVDEDAAVAGLLHLGHNLLDAEKDALDVDVHDHVVVLLGGVAVGLVAVGGAGVVDDNVDFAVGVEGFLQAGFPLVTLGHVGKVEFAAEFLRGFGADRFAEVGDDYFSALGEELLDDAFAEALA